MDDAVWLASIFGPIFTIIGLWALLRFEEARELWASMKSNPAILYLGGVINLLIGFTILSIYRDWTMNLAVLVTLLGYVQAIRGILILFCHDWVVQMTQNLMRKPSVRWFSLIPLCWGIAMCVLAAS